MTRVNARVDDTFDIFNLKHYSGPNPYLDTAALVFDFRLTYDPMSRSIQHYLAVVSRIYPTLREGSYLSVAHLFGHVVTEVNQLDMDLHLTKFSLKIYTEQIRIAIQTLHGRTTRSVIYFVWDWFETISKGENFDFAPQFEELQQTFRNSVYGGPTVYALIRKAYEQGIPTTYLWDEQLVQYGYGRKQVRGAGTTFDRDSRLDSDFTTRKDDCKAFLSALGFPVPTGEVVRSLKGAKAMAEELGYPVALKPVTGHKGIGVTANIHNAFELEFAYDTALAAIPLDEPVLIIVEKHMTGTDFRLLCVDGHFVAAIERRPPFIIGDGQTTIETLIERENTKTERLDTPTSPLGKIIIDEALEQYLAEQSLMLTSVPDTNQKINLRKVANLSAGGVSYDATPDIHPDNVALAEDIAQHFRLTCLGIDVITRTLSRSWQDGQLGIIEINAAPGIFMHLKPAVGQSTEVTAAILDTFFQSPADARIPIITFNQLTTPLLKTVIEQLLYHHPDWKVGGVCRESVWINSGEKVLHPDYNQNVHALLRHPKLDLLVVEYWEATLEADGMAYHGSNMVILEDPTSIEMMLVRDVLIDSSVIIKRESDISIQSRGLMDQFQLSSGESFRQIFLREITRQF